MNRVSFKKIPLRPNHAAASQVPFHHIFFALFLIQFALVCINLWLPSSLFGDHRWPDGLLVLLAGATVVVSLTRQLPGQNVMLASIIIAVLSGAVVTAGALTGIPFGPFVYTENVGDQLFRLPWAMPIVWIVAILSSRGVARLTMRPWRKTRKYGFWLMGLTAAFVVVLDLGLEPFARVNRYWLWNPTRLGLAWYGAPWVNFLGWGMTVLLILAFTTPALINKKPVKQPPDYQPLIVWLLLNALFATGAFTNGLWPAAAVIASASAAVTVFAVRGARW